MLHQTSFLEKTKEQQLIHIGELRERRFIVRPNRIKLGKLRSELKGMEHWELSELLHRLSLRKRKDSQ